MLNSITRTENKQEKGVLQRRKSWCIRGDQQEYYIDDRYSPVLKAPEVRFLTGRSYVYCGPVRMQFLQDSYQASVFIWWYGQRRSGTCDSRMMIMTMMRDRQICVRTNPGVSCVSAQESHLWDEASGSTVAHENINLDGR